MKYSKEKLLKQYRKQRKIRNKTAYLSRKFNIQTGRVAGKQ